MTTTTSARRATGLSAWAWVVAAATLGACAEGPPPTAPTTSPAATLVDAAGNAIGANEPGAIRELTRAAAMAMRDAGVRQQVGRDMRSGGVTRELKLELRSFIKGNAGGVLLAKMSERSGISRDSLMRLITMVRPLEFYMPSRAHRQRWRGEDVLVASQLRESDPITAFDEQGHAVALGSSPPETPTFALVPVETNFAVAPYESETSGSATSTRVATGSASRTLTTGCDPATMLCDGYYGGGDSGGGSPQTIPSNAPTGMYLVYANFYDVKEPWLKGDPEIEAHVIGPSIADATGLVRDLHCSGQNEPGWYRFDQNADQWYGAVLVYPQDAMVSNNFVQQMPDSRQFAVAMYEDDYQSCITHDDGMRLVNAMAWAAVWAYKTYGLLANCPDVVCMAIVAGSYASDVAKWAWSTATTNDDFLGLAVDRASTPDYYDIYASHSLIDNTTINGGVKLTWHVYGT
ncbi:MAG TPA: hypothetical protein VF159_00755 [Gemmatimonadaceae bacterium]